MSLKTVLTSRGRGLSFFFNLKYLDMLSSILENEFQITLDFQMLKHFKLKRICEHNSVQESRFFTGVRMLFHSV